MGSRKFRNNLPAGVPFLAIIVVLLSACFVDPEYVFRVSEGELQFPEQEYFRGNVQFDYRVELPYDKAELLLYGYTKLPEENDGDYHLTLRIMVVWDSSISEPTYYLPGNVQIHIGGIQMKIEGVYRVADEGPASEGKPQYKQQYIRIEFACSIDSLKKVASSRGRMAARTIIIDLSELMIIDGKFVPIGQIYARDSREILGNPDGKD